MPFFFLNSMHMTPLSLSDLITIATDVIQYAKVYYPNYLYYLNTLRLTGCRPAEPLISNLWSWNEDSTINLIPLKNNNPRTFLPTDLDPDFLNMILTDNFLFDETRQRSMLRAFNISNRTGKFQTLNDRSSLYIFRYIKAKELHQEGKSMSEIQSYFGWKSVHLAQQYVEKVLYR